MADRKNILVAGGAGFIGSHLCDELVRENNVVCLDNFITGQEENIDHLLENPQFEFLRHDVTIPFSIDQFPELKKFRVESLGFQEIYHLACPTSPKEYHRVPIETLHANALGTINICKLATEHKAKLVHLSTSAVYGEPLEYEPFKEEYLGMVNAVGPRSCYNEGKRFAETIVANYTREFGLQAKIARVFNTYGPRMRTDDGRMIPDFIISVLKKEPIVIYGGPDDASSYCYVSDIVDALIKLMAAETPELAIFNIGSESLVKFVDVAEIIMHQVGVTVPIQYESHLPYTQEQGVPDISKAKEVLRWFPVVKLEVGLRKAIDYMKARVKKKELR